MPNRFVFKKRTMASGFALAICFLFLLVGCDPPGTLQTYLKPDVPQENLLKVYDSWLFGQIWEARLSGQGVSLNIRGDVSRSGGGTVYHAKIKNAREYEIKLARVSLSMKEDERAFSPGSAKLFSMSDRNWTEEIIVPPASTVEASFFFREAKCPRGSVVLTIDAFEDVHTRDKIPFVIRFLLAEPFVPTPGSGH